MKRKGTKGMTKRLLSFGLASVLVFSTLGLSACGNKMTAIVMRLMKSEGQVVLTDEKDAEKSMLENMNLYSGYHLKTGNDGEVKINMDDTRLVTLGNNSLLGFEKENKAMRLSLEEGEMFFNITEKLEDDESLDLETSTMVVGIRGTFGWMDDKTVYLLHGHTTIKIKDPETGIEKTLELTTGQKLELRESDNEKGKWTYEKGTIQVEDIPPLAKQEVASNSDMAKEVMKEYKLSALELQEQLGLSLPESLLPEQEEKVSEPQESNEEEEETQTTTKKKTQEPAEPQQEEPTDEMTPEQRAEAERLLAKEMAEKAAADAAAAAAVEEPQEPAGPTATTVNISINPESWRIETSSDGTELIRDNIRLPASGSNKTYSCRGFTITTYYNPQENDGVSYVESMSATVYKNSGDNVPVSIVYNGSQVSFTPVGEGYRAELDGFGSIFYDGETYILQ